jgi:hypothetical protein
MAAKVGRVSSQKPKTEFVSCTLKDNAAEQQKPVLSGPIRSCNLSRAKPSLAQKILYLIIT